MVVKRENALGSSPGALAVFVNQTGYSLGAEGRNRTGDTMIFSHVLYRLSYLGVMPSPVIPRAWAIEGSNL
jgi:hypothetical protein